VFDAPETTGLFDAKTRVFFSADCFGALLTEPADSASEVKREALRDGLVTWATVDAPWLPLVDEARYEKALREVAAMGPTSVLSAHLPPATGMVEALTDYLFQARTAAPFIGPDQTALEAMMARA
jgi:hypothetical protein